MKTKKIFKHVFSAFILVSVWFAFFQASALAVSVTGGCVTADSNGNVTTGLILGSGGSASCNSGGTGGTWAGIPTAFPGLPSGHISDIITNILYWLLGIFATLGIIGFVLSGIWYLLSAGEESMAEKGKEGMKWSIIGVIIGLSGFIIMQAVNTLLGGMDRKF